MGGRKKTEVLASKCHKCNGEVYLTERSLTCTFCRNIFHNDCINVDRVNYEKIKKLPVWFCNPVCRESYDKEKGEMCDLPQDPTNRDLLLAIQSFKTSQNFLSEKYEDIAAKMEELMKTIQSMDKRITDLEEEKQVLKSKFEKELNINRVMNEVSEQEKLKNNVILSGVSNEVENSVAVVKQICQKLDPNLNIIDDDVLKIERLFIQKDGIPADKKIKKIPVVVSFSNPEIKAKILKAQKQKKELYSDECDLPGENGKMVFRDQLSSSSFKILKSARALRHNNKIKYAWVQESKVLVRKDDTSRIIWIKSVYDLTVFESEGQST